MTTLVAPYDVRHNADASRRSLSLLALSTALGLLHHTDHVLRGDHSGWPFTPHVTPFTYSLGVYVLLLLAFLTQSRPSVSAAAVGLVLAATQVSHIVFELPWDQYGTWANGTNLLCVASPPLGVAAACLSLALSAALAATTLSFIGEARGGSEGQRPARHVSNKFQRQIVRLAHLVAASTLGFAVYGPLAEVLALRAAMQYAVFPALALTGLWLWLGPRILARLKRGGR